MSFANRREKLMFNASVYNFSTTKKRKVKCVICGKTFITSHPCKKTCSVECSMDQHKIYEEELKKDMKRYYSKNKKSKNKQK